MKFIVKRKRQIIWYAPCNTIIHNKIVFSEEEEVFTFYSMIIPRIGERISVDKKEYKILDLIYKLKKSSNCESYLLNANDSSTVILIIEPFIKYVDYYDYMKTFTHCRDNFKLDKDVTKYEDFDKYVAVFPETFLEWQNDIHDLEISKNDDIQNSCLIEFANRRCKKQA